MVKTKKTILGIVLGVLMALCLIVGITGLSSPKTALAISKSSTSDWSEGKLFDNESGNEFLALYNDSDGKKGNFELDLNYWTWSITEEVDTEDLKIGCLRIKNGTINITDDIESDICFDIYGGLEFENVTFMGNSIEVEHLVRFKGVSQGWNRCNINNCKFISCDSDTDGGVFYFDFDDGYINTINITNCSFDSCWNSGCGSVLYLNDVGTNNDKNVANINLGGSTFVNCKSDGDGGVIYVNDKYVDIASFDNLNKIYFWNCGSHENDGGVIYLWESNCRVWDSVFHECWANNNGGAIYVDGDNCSIVNCEFYECSIMEDGDGAAIYVDNPGCAIDNCTLVKNYKEKYTCYFKASATITDSIFSNKNNFGGVGPNLYRCQFDGSGTREYEINLGTGTLMTDGNLAILFGVLAGVFLITAGTFAYLYFAGKKKKN